MANRISRKEKCFYHNPVIEPMSKHLALANIKDVLSPGEKLEFVAEESVLKDITPEVVAVTDSRIIVWEWKVVGSKITSIPRNQITSIDVDSGIAFSRVTIRTSQKEIKLDLTRGDAEKLMKVLHMA